MAIGLIELYQGLESNLPSSAPKNQLFFTDTGKLFRGTDVGIIEYSKYVITTSDLSTISSPAQDKIYIDTTHWTVNAYNGTSWKVLGGSVTETSNSVLTNKTLDATFNTISNLDTTNFKSSAISTSINESSPVDSKIPSEKAVVSYVQSKTSALASGLIYKGVIDASSISNLPVTLKTGDFYKVSVAGTISSVDLQVGDILIANNTKSSGVTITDFDKIDNSESSDILRLANVSTNSDFTIDGTKLTDRSTIKAYVESSLSWQTF